MNYDVIWVPSAEDQLAAIWISAPDRSAVARAADRIDHLLSAAPGVEGESRPDNRRVLIELPLVVYYEVGEDDRRVRVLRVIEARSLR